MAFERIKSAFTGKVNREKLQRELQRYLDLNYQPEETEACVLFDVALNEECEEDIAGSIADSRINVLAGDFTNIQKEKSDRRKSKRRTSKRCDASDFLCSESITEPENETDMIMQAPQVVCPQAVQAPFFFDEKHESELEERMKHLSDSFSEYLLYLIESRGMKNSEVYHRALVDKKTFSKLRNNPEYHPNKMTAMCLCVGAELNLDESKDLLARAGYALSPCNKADVIFSFFIEHEIYDIYEIDIQLEEHGMEPLVNEDKIFN